MRQRKGRARRWRNRRANAQAALGKCLGNIFEHACLAAKQMRHRATINQQTIGPVKRAPRAPAQCPNGQLFKKGQIARCIGWMHCDFRKNRPRIGQHHAGLSAIACALIADRLNPRAMGGIADQSMGDSLPFVSKLPAIHRQIGQPNRYNPPRAGLLFFLGRMSFLRSALPYFCHRPAAFEVA